MLFDTWPFFFFTFIRLLENFHKILYFSTFYLQISYWLCHLSVKSILCLLPFDSVILLDTCPHLIRYKSVYVFYHYLFYTIYIELNFTEICLPFARYFDTRFDSNIFQCFKHFVMHCSPNTA